MKRIIVLASMAALLLAACGGDQTADSDQPTVTSAPEADDPGAVGDEIGRVYVAGYGDVVSTLADRPDAGTALSLLTDLKESYVQQMVTLGHRREAFDEAGRATVDARINSALAGLSTETFEAYQEASTHYSSDFEVAELIADFNIIGQYANFDLLRDQSPEEAARLGVG